MFINIDIFRNCINRERNYIGIYDNKNIFFIRKYEL